MMTRFSTRGRRVAVAVVLATAASGIATVGAAAPSGAALPACTTTWTNTAGGSWDTAASWSGGTVPTVDDHVCITTAGTYTVTVADPGDPVEVASLRVGAASGTTTQTLVVARGVDTEVEDSLYAEGIEISPRGVIELGASATGGIALGAACGCEGVGIVNAGTIRQASGSDEDHSIWTDVLNTGVIDVDQPLRIEGSLTVDGAGQLQVDDDLHVSDLLWTKGGSVRGSGSVTVGGEIRVGEGDTDPAEEEVPSLTVEDGGMLTFQAGSPIDVVTHGAVLLTGSTAAGQDITVQSRGGDPAALVFEGTLTNRGHLVLDPGDDEEADAVLAGFDLGSAVVNEGELERTNADRAAVVVADLVNRGTVRTTFGAIDVVGDLENEGRLDLELGGLTVEGDVLLDPTSTVAVTIAGAGDVPRILAEGDVTLAGGLDVHTESAPPVGTTVRLIEGGSRVGSFAELAFTGAASWDAVYTDTGADLVRRAGEPASSRFVRAAFQDFLDRQPTPTELEQRSAAIDGGTLTRAAVVRQLSLSPEYVTALVQRFYADTLGRPGEPGGVTYWVDELRSGRRTVAQVAGSFYASPEYFQRTGNNTSDWVWALYDVFFDRPPSGPDQTYWTNKAHARGRTQVAVEMFQSLESRRARVEVLYGSLLGRPGDADGVDYWAARIGTEGDLALAVFLASSSEYLARAQERYP